MPNRNILISGCSGGGKSTLLDALLRLGYAVIPEPGRRIVAEENRGDGAALPWVDPLAFAARAMQMAKADLAAAEEVAGFIFYDRGLVDAAVGYAFAGGPPFRSLLSEQRHYAERVYFAPPWPEIYVTDADRQHSFDDAKAEYMRLVQAFNALGYKACTLPKVPVQERVDFVQKDLGIA